MDSPAVVRPPKSTLKDSRFRRLKEKKTPKNKRYLPTSAQVSCNSESATKNLDHRGAVDTVVPRDWVDTTSEAAIQQLVDIISAQDDNTVGAQVFGPPAPPSQSPLSPFRNSPPLDTMQEWLEEPNISQPFNNIEAFPVPVTDNRQSARGVEDEEYTIEGWSVAYYASEDSLGHMVERS